MALAPGSFKMVDIPDAPVPVPKIIKRRPGHLSKIKLHADPQKRRPKVTRNLQGNDYCMPHYAADRIAIKLEDLTAQGGDRTEAVQEFLTSLDDETHVFTRPTVVILRFHRLIQDNDTIPERIRRAMNLYFGK